MSTSNMSDIARELAQRSVPTRVEFSWLGRRKSLNAEQKETIADSFGAEARSVGASKLLLNPKQEQVKSMTWIRGEIKSYWERMTLPHPEKGIRLLKRTKVNEFDEQMEAYGNLVRQSARAMQNHREEILEDAARHQGTLFNRADYPADFSGAFSVSVDYPSVEPPAYLAELAPEVYQRSLEAAQAQFVDAANTAAQEFIEELAAGVQKLADTLSGQNEDGKPKVIKEAHLSRLTEFFERFRDLKVGDIGELDTIVNRAEHAIGGLSREALRDNTGLRTRVAGVMEEIHSQLEPLMVNRPTRVIRRAGTEAPTAAPAVAPTEPESGLFPEDLAHLRDDLVQEIPGSIEVQS